jgi:ketosteroid isomerase-like protein
MSDAKLVGGSEADRKKLLQLLDDYIEANEHFDWQRLAPIWSEQPEATFFNLNGHTYNGGDHWRRLWAFYKENVKGSYWTPFDIGGVVTDDMAVIWCHRDTRRNWVGKDRPPRDIHYQGDKFVTRSTMVFHKEGRAWRVVHAHFSEADSGPRPGGI